MGNPVPLATFLNKVKVIYNLHPKYRQPGDGSDGTCDCIGLIIGAIRRSGGTWTGIHGSNYAARYETNGLKDIKSVNDLFVGMIVYKFTTDQKNLPDRYKPGKSYYNGDLNDYYHVGVVVSVSPLQIFHMTSPTVKIDKDLGKWRRGGSIKKVNYNGSVPSGGDSDDKGGTIVVEKYKAKVVTSGGSLNLRKSSDPNSALVDRIPNGTIIPIFDDSKKMYLTEYKNQKGYVSSEFLKKVDGSDDDTDKEVGVFIPLPENVAKTVIDAMKKAKLMT